MLSPTAHGVLDWLRLSLGGAVLGLALLATLPPANAQIWLLSVPLLEGGYWSVILLPLLCWPRWSVRGVALVGGSLGVIGVLLLVAPVVTAISVGHQFPAQFAQAFPDRPAALDGPARQAPLVLSDLFLGVRSEDVVVEERVFDVVNGVELVLDVYRPSAQHPPLPGVVMVHGGSWQGGSRKDFSALNRYLAARGYVVAAISYRFSPRFLFPAALDDVSAALGYLEAHAQELGLDRDRLALVGRSAGGQLALIAGYRLDHPAIKAVVSLYGPVALRWGFVNPAKRSIIDSSAVLEAYLGGSPTTHGSQYDAASPLAHVGHHTPPTLLVSGARDELVSPFHAEFLSDRLIRADVPHVVVRLPWGVHGCDFFFRGPCGQLSTFAVERFLAAALGTPG